MRFVAVIFFFTIFSLKLLPGQAYGILNNQVCKGSMTSNGILFYSNNQPNFSYPSNSSNQVLALSGIWISAQKPDDSIVASYFNETGSSDFQAGPLQFGTLNPADLNTWNNVYFASKAEIEYHFKNHKKSDYVTPETIKNWPAHPPSGFQGILAPFVDWNGNNLYEPPSGEYPYIEGDQTLFSVYHDNGVRNGIAGDPLGVEIKQFWYSFTENEAKKGEWQFFRIIVTNKNNFTLRNFSLGFSSHIWLGTGLNNYIESYPQENAVTGYTPDSLDNLPAVSIVSLNKAMSSCFYLNEVSDMVTGYPTNKKEVFNLLNGKWKNGKELTYGGNGVDGSTPAKFVFPADRDTSNQLFSWTEESSGNVSGKRRVLLNTESVDFQSAQSIEYRFAIMIHPDKNKDKIQNDLIHLQNAYLSGGLTSVYPKNIEPYFHLFPNPSKISSGFQLLINNPNPDITLTDINGRKQLITIENKSSGNYSVKPTHQIAEGIYFLKISGVHYSITKKIIFLD